jgi:hypothetical protein
MIFRAAALVLSVLLAQALAGPVLAAEMPEAQGPFSPSACGSLAEPTPCIPEADYAALARLPNVEAGSIAKFGTSPALFPLFAWPLQKDTGEGISMGPYPDEGAGSLVMDYMGGGRSYDTHAGTDFGVLNFHAMDRGEPVLSAAAGRVLATAYINADRNYQAPFGPANYILVEPGRDACKRRLKSAARVGAVENRGTPCRRPEVVQIPQGFSLRDLDPIIRRPGGVHGHAAMGRHPPPRPAGRRQQAPDSA